MEWQHTAMAMAAVLGICVLACSSGNQQVVQQQQYAEQNATEASPDAGTADGGEATSPTDAECTEAAKTCDGCDEVQRMRRKILARKCAPYCDVYGDRGAKFEASVRPQTIEIVRQNGICGKHHALCSVKQETACSRMLDYATAGDTFRSYWASVQTVGPADELMVRYLSTFVDDFLQRQRAVWSWAVKNDYDAEPLLKAGAKIMQIEEGSSRAEFAGEIGSAIRAATGEEKKKLTGMWVALEQMRQAILEPGDSFEENQARVAKARKAFARLAPNEEKKKSTDAAATS